MASVSAAPTATVAPTTWVAPVAAGAVSAAAAAKTVTASGMSRAGPVVITSRAAPAGATPIAATVMVTTITGGSSRAAAGATAGCGGIKSIFPLARTACGYARVIFIALLVTVIAPSRMGGASTMTRSRS